MCGIFGIVTNDDNTRSVIKTIVDSLAQLQNRGYDSSGLGFKSMGFNIPTIQKYISNENSTSIEKLYDYAVSDKVNESIPIIWGMGHNRWATHGKKSSKNAHPHISSDYEVMVVHNGIIENYQELKNDLIKNNFTFRSDTDTEVIANLIAFHYKKCKNQLDSIKNTLNQLEGTYGLLIGFIGGSHTLYGISHGSPLLIGMNNESILFSSEPSGFNKMVSSYIILETGDVAIASLSKDNKLLLQTNATYTSHTIPNIFTSTSSPAPYAHWTLKEIYEQPETIKRAINNGGRIENNIRVKLGGLEEHYGNLMIASHIVFLGCGSSYHVSCIAKYLLQRTGARENIIALDASEFEMSDVPREGTVCFVFISQSGETKELYSCMELLKKEDNRRFYTVGIVNVVNSLIARNVDCGIYCNGGRERGVASTKSFTSQTICVSLLVIWFSQIATSTFHFRKDIISSIKELPEKTTDFLSQDLHCNLQPLLLQFNKVNNVFILGKGIDLIVAQESCLKLKEIAYIHAEAYSSSSLKHGPFALLDENFPVILIDTQPEYYKKNDIAIQEISSRGAPIYIITNRERIGEKHSNVLVIPQSSYSFLFALYYLQLLGYYLSLEKQINPDIPRNLAKVVTVE